MVTIRGWNLFTGRITIRDSNLVTEIVKIRGWYLFTGKITIGGSNLVNGKATITACIYLLEGLRSEAQI